MIKKIDKILTVVEERLLQVLFIAMTVVTLVQVFNRVLINYPMPWGDELARYLFVWVIYLAASYAVRAKSHIGVTALVERFPAAPRRVIDFFVNLVCLSFSLLLFMQTLKIIQTQIALGQTSPSMRLPMQYVYMGLAVGGLLMSLRFILRMIEDLRPKESSGPENGEKEEFV